MPEPAAELTPDPNYRLTDAQRERLAPAFDPDAVESLFALYPDSEQRERALADFLSMADQVARGEISMTGIRYLGDNAQERRAVRSLAERSPFSAGQRIHFTRSACNRQIRTVILASNKKVDGKRAVSTNPVERCFSVKS